MFIHTQGQLVYLPSRISHLALDTMFVKKRLQIGVGIEPNEQVGKRVACVGETTQVWTKNVIGKLLKEQVCSLSFVFILCPLFHPLFCRGSMSPAYLLYRIK